MDELQYKQLTNKTTTHMVNHVQNWINSENFAVTNDSKTLAASILYVLQGVLYKDHNLISSGIEGIEHLQADL